MCENDLEMRFTYSWNWFKYHAQQRLIAFHYFLIIVGIIGVGYIQSGRDIFLKSLLCFLGMVISFAFFKLEIRNEGLVNFARDELDKLDDDIGVEIRKKDKQEKEKQYKVPISHRFWLRTMASAIPRPT